MATINFLEGMSLAEKSPFWAVRGKAIQSYANLEQSLCRIFQHVGNIDKDVAAVIFYKVTSTSARNAILEKLIRMKFGPMYNLFWNSIIKNLRPIDIQRNEIVHWNVTSMIDADQEGKTTASVFLKPPTSRLMDPDTPRWDEAGFQAFMDKCWFYSRTMNMFLVETGGYVTQGEWREDERATWREIFLQPVVYPPQAGHPLFPTWQASQIPPQSSQA